MTTATTPPPDARHLFRICGADRISFLQGLVSNDVSRLSQGLVYAALLTPQGKYLADFFLTEQQDCVVLDVAEVQADALLLRLNMYRLRAEVSISNASLFVTRGTGSPPPGAFADPRHPALGWRLYSATETPETPLDWDAIRVAHCIPATNIELIPNQTYVLEAGFERLHGVDFRKGCYVGQEVTARMKHKTSLKKGLVTVAVDGKAPVGTPIMADGKEAGTLYTQSGGKGIAYLRFDRATGKMQAAKARVARI